MIAPFYLKLLLGFVIGGLWVSLGTLAAETFGTRVGGFIGGLPSTIVVALVFIGWTQGSEQVFRATTVLPLAFSVNAVYLITYAVLARKAFAWGIVGALSAWFLFQGLLGLLEVNNLTLATAVWLLVFVASYDVLQNRLRIRSHEKIALRHTPSQIAWRAGFGGAVIVLAIMMSKIGGPIWGGIFSAFPAVYTSTLVITSQSGGVEFSRSLITPLMISGVISPVVFGIAFRYTVFGFNLFEAAAIAYAISMVSAFLTFLFMERRML